MSIRNLSSQLQGYYTWINHRSGGIPEILLTALQRFTQERGAQAAASIGYYALFSLFPLLLVLVWILGFFLSDWVSTIEIADLITDFIPVSQDIIYENLVHILELSSVGGIIGLLGLLWSSMSAFYTLSFNINRAWPMASRKMIHHRLIALLMILVLLVLMGLYLVFNTILSFSPNLQIHLTGFLTDRDFDIWKLVYRMVPVLITFLVLLFLYKWIPNTTVHWSESYWGALIATVAIYLSTAIYSWFLKSGIVSYENIYGSLGAIIATMSWIYLIAYIALLGAHMSAAIAIVKRVNHTPEEFTS